MAKVNPPAFHVPTLAQLNEAVGVGGVKDAGEAARDALVQMAVSLVSKDGRIKDGYLRVSGDGRLGRGVFGKRAENQTANERVRALVTAAFGEHAGVTAEFDRYLAVRSNKIGTESFVKLVKTLNAVKPDALQKSMSDAPLMRREAGEAARWERLAPMLQRLNEAQPKENTRLKAELISSSIQLTDQNRALQSIFDEALASFKAGQPGGVPNRLTTAIAGATEGAQRVKQSLGGAEQLIERESVKAEVDRLDSLIDELTRLRDLAARQDELAKVAKPDGVPFNWKSKGWLSSRELDRLSQQAGQARANFDALARDVAVQLRGDLDEHALTPPQALLDLERGIAFHNQRRESICFLIDSGKHGEAVTGLMAAYKETLPKHQAGALDPASLESRCIDLGFKYAADPAIRRAAIHEYLIEDALQHATTCFARLTGLDSQEALGECFAPGKPVAEANQASSARAIESALDLLKAFESDALKTKFITGLPTSLQLAILQGLEEGSPERAACLAGLRVAELPPRSGELGHLSAGEWINALGRMSRLADKIQTCSAIGVAQAGTVLARDENSPLSEPDRTEIFKSLRKETQSELLAPGAQPISRELKLKFFKALDSQRQSELLTRLCEGVRDDVAVDPEALDYLSDCYAALEEDSPALRLLLTRLSQTGKLVEYFAAVGHRYAYDDDDPFNSSWIFGHLDPAVRKSVLASLLDDSSISEDYLTDLISQSAHELFDYFGERDGALLDRVRARSEGLWSKAVLAAIDSAPNDEVSASWRSLPWKFANPDLAAPSRLNGRFLKVFADNKSDFSAYLASLAVVDKAKLVQFFNGLLPDTGDPFTASDLDDATIIDRISERMQVLKGPALNAILEGQVLAAQFAAVGLQPDPRVERLFHLVVCRHLAAAYVSGHETDVLRPQSADVELFRSRQNLIFETSSKIIPIEKTAMMGALLKVCGRIKADGKAPHSEGIYVTVTPSSAEGRGGGHALGILIEYGGESGEVNADTFKLKFYDPNFTDAWREIDLTWEPGGKIRLNVTGETLSFEDPDDVNLGLDSLFRKYYDNPVASLHFAPDSIVNLSVRGSPGVWNSDFDFSHFEDVFRNVCRSAGVKGLQALGKKYIDKLDDDQKRSVRKFIERDYLRDDGRPGFYSQVIARWTPRARLKAEFPSEAYDRVKVLTGMSKAHRSDDDRGRGRLLGAIQAAMQSASEADQAILLRAQALTAEMEKEWGEFFAAIKMIRDGLPA